LIRFIALLLACTPVLACEYPDEGNMPLRRAVARVKFLPETEAWAASMHKAGSLVGYALRLDQPRREHGRCYWPVDVRADGKLWRRFYVTPDGKRLLRPEAKAPRAATPPPAATAAAR
jgi:hypothetical protein